MIAQYYSAYEPEKRNLLGQTAIMALKGTRPVFLQPISNQIFSVFRFSWLQYHTGLRLCGMKNLRGNKNLFYGCIRGFTGYFRIMGPNQSFFNVLRHGDVQAPDSLQNTTRSAGFLPRANADWEYTQRKSGV